MERARQGVRGNRTGQAVPASCRSPELNAPGNHQLVVLSPRRVAYTPMSGSRWYLPPWRRHSIYSVVCDCSSTLGAACKPTALLRAFDFWIAQGLARPASSLSVELVGPSRDTMRTLYHISVPELSLGDRVAFILGARAELGELLRADLFEKNASAIVEAIHATVSKLRERQRPVLLVVLSDLRQLTPEWDFDQIVPQTPIFLTWLKKTHLLADLRDTPLLICGMHTHRAPGRGLHTAARAAQLHDLWQAVFQASGAPEVKLFSTCETAFAAS